MQTAESILDDNDGSPEDKNDNSDDAEEEMRRASAWFGFGIDQEKENASKEAARITREADIRRLYEAGTQREVLEELYNPEEVLKCIEQIDKERALLQMLEDEQLMEAAAEDAAVAEKNRLAQEKIDKERQEKERLAKEVEDAESASCGDLSVSQQDSQKDSIVEELGASGLSLGSRKFKISFGDHDEDGNVKTKVEAEELTPPRDGAPVSDRTMDISLDDVNLLAIDLDLESVAPDDKDDHHDNLLPSIEQESENDLLQELLNTEGEESSHFEDSFTTHENLENPTELNQTNSNTTIEESPLVTIDTSVMRETSGITVDISLGSQRRVSSMSELGDSNRPRISLNSDVDLGNHAPEDAVTNGSEKEAVESPSERSCEKPEPEESGSKGKIEKESPGEDEDGSQKEADFEKVGDKESATGASNVTAPAKDETDGTDKEPATDLIAGDDGQDLGEGQTAEVGDAGESAAPKPERPQGMNESDGEQEDQMDAESEVEVMSADEEEAEVMDDSEQMETTSVEDDEELSGGGSKEGAQADEVMKEETRSVDMEAGKCSFWAVSSDEKSTFPLTNGKVDETVEEVLMDEIVSDDGLADVIVADDSGDASNAAQGLATSSEDDSSSEGSSPLLPPPPPPAAPAEIEEEYQEEEIVEDQDDNEEEIIVEDEDGNEVEEEVIEDEGEGEDVVEIVDADGNVVAEEEVVEGEELDEEEVSDASSYADQVVESWHEVIEEEPEDLEAAVSALIAVVYQGENVDVESMLRRTRLPELYKYLKQQYWYKIHTNQLEQNKAAATVVAEMPSQILGVDDMLKSRLQGLIADVQQLDQSLHVDNDPSENHEDKMQNLITNVQSSSRNLMASEKKGMPESSLLGAGEEDVEEDLLPPGSTGRVDKKTIHSLSAKDGSQRRGRHHVAKYYEKAVNNRVTRVETKAPPMQEKLPPKKTKRDNVLLDIQSHEFKKDDEAAKNGGTDGSDAAEAAGKDDEYQEEEIVDDQDDNEEEIIVEDEDHGDDVEEEVMDDDEGEGEEIVENEEVSDAEEEVVLEEEEVVEGDDLEDEVLESDAEEEVIEDDEEIIEDDESVEEEEISDEEVEEL